MSKVKINYNNTFATKHSRDYYRGASFHFSGKWIIGAHYISDDYNIDFVVHDQVLLACAKSHLSSLENKPINFIRDERGTVIGVISIYWDFVCSGIVGNSPGVKIVNNYWWICEDVNLPVEQQVWVNTGVKAKLEFSDLTPEEIAELTQPGIDAAINTINSKIKQTTGSSESDLMSQKAITDEFVNVTLDIADINAKIPIDASSDNQLADKEYVNEHIATATATFQGTYNLVTDLELNVDATREQIANALDNEITNPDNNDYCFVQIPTSISEPTEIKKVERYKFNGTNWAFEYELNNSGFTNAQWAAINSGVVTNDVTKLRALPTNSELQASFAEKQDSPLVYTIPSSGGKAMVNVTDSCELLICLSSNYENEACVLVSVGVNPSPYVISALLLSGSINAGAHPGIDKVYRGSIGGYPNDKYYVGFQMGTSAGPLKISVFTISGTPPVSISDPSGVTITSSKDIAYYQDKLVSGTNIKTINSTSLLGSGDIQISTDTSDCVKVTSQSFTDSEKEQARINIDAREVKHFSVSDGKALLIPLEDEGSLAMSLQMDYVNALYVISTTPSNPGLVRIVDNQVGTSYWNFERALYNGLFYYIMITNDGDGDGIVVSLSPLSGDLDGVLVVDTESSVITDTTPIVPETFETSSNKVTSISSASTDAEYPSAKCVYDALVANDKVFVATYGTTTYQAVLDAYNARKVVVCFYGNRSYVLDVAASGSAVQFSTVESTTVYQLILSTSDGWANNSINLQRVYKVTTWSATPNNVNYPSEKLVYDSLYPQNGTTQPQTGMLPNVMYVFGELSADTTFLLNTTDVYTGSINHYYWTFDTPSVAPTITWPVEITSWFGGSAPVIVGNKHYEISVLNGIAVSMEV